MTSNPQAQLPAGSDAYQPKLAVDSAGHVWVAWYSSSDCERPVRAAARRDDRSADRRARPRAGSNNIDNNAQGTALACAATCRLVYIDGPSGSPTGKFESWWIGQAAPTTLASLPDTGVFADAYRSDGHLWVAWWNGKTYSYELGDATGAGGTVQDAGLPAGGGMGAYAIRIAAVGENLLMGVNFNFKSGQGVYGIFVNDVAPPVPVTYAPGPRQTTLVATPGGKSFRIQVQYRVSASCKPSCSAHAELRTRNGRQQYAVSATAPLPGDGKVVLGTRAVGQAPGRQEGALLPHDQQGRAEAGAVHHRRRQPRREHASARLAEDEERTAADGARREDRRLDRAHQVGRAAGSRGDSLSVSTGGSTPDQ